MERVLQLAIPLAALVLGVPVLGDPPAGRAGGPGVVPAAQTSGAQPSAPKGVPQSDDDTTELVVQLKDGRRYTGPVVRQNSQEVVIALAGVPMRFEIDEIEKLETLEPLMVRYKKLREAVGDSPEQIVGLAEWLQAREKYEIALTEVERALTIDKNCATALKLKPVLEQQVILRHARVKKETAATPDGKPDPSRPAPQRPKDFPLLSEVDVQLMKVFETNFDEHPRLIIPRAVTQKLLDTYAKSPLVPITREGRDAILRQSPAEILDLMFKLQAREFYSQVEVLDQPRSFIAFRDQVCRTWLVNSCATTACHGGTEAGRFVLYNAKPNSERTVYTNFLILTRYRLADGTPLLDFEEPEASALLQYGMPREKSRHPHPVVPRGVNEHDAFKPFFRNTDDATFAAAVEWIKSLYKPRPEYPINYTPARPFEAPKPAGAPGTGGGTGGTPVPAAVPGNAPAASPGSGGSGGPGPSQPSADGGGAGTPPAPKPQPR